jgi:hypothetical protein
LHFFEMKSALGEVFVMTECVEQTTDTKSSMTLLITAVVLRLMHVELLCLYRITLSFCLLTSVGWFCGESLRKGRNTKSS